MRNRLTELESNLRRQRRKANGSGQNKVEAASSMMAGIGPSRGARARGKRRVPSGRSAGMARPAAAVRGFTAPVSYQVPDPVPVLAQPSGMSCWATVYTMLYSWKRQQSMTIETALGDAGQRWLDVFRSDSGLSGGDKVDFVSATGLVAEAPQNFSVPGWERLLRDYGPLWVTGDEAPGAAWAIHARIIVGIQGDGTPEGTRFSIIDPAGGRRYDEAISVFIPKYEEEVRRTGYMRIQVIHWPRDARSSRSQSVSHTRAVAPPTPAAHRPAVAGGKGHATPLGEIDPAFVLTSSLHPVGPAAALDAHARAMNPVAIAGLGLAVFNTGRQVFFQGDVEGSATPASYVHPNTPPDTPAHRINAEFELNAHHPRYGFDRQHFWFRLDTDVNGYDIKAASITLLRDRSSELTASSFSVSFQPLARSGPNEAVAHMVFIIEGRWDPMGRGDVSFSGELHLKADGTMTLSVSSERNWVRGGTFTNVRRTPLPGPIVVTPFWDVQFSPPGSDTVSDTAIRELRGWYDRLSAELRGRIERGDVPIELNGYASTTGSVADNQALARRRAENVQRVLGDFAGSTARFRVVVHGETRARTGDNVESPEERRVRVSVTTYQDR